MQLWLAEKDLKEILINLNDPKHETHTHWMIVIFLYLSVISIYIVLYSLYSTCILRVSSHFNKSYTVLKTAKLLSRYRTNVATTRATERLTDVSPNLFPNAEWGFYAP